MSDVPYAPLLSRGYLDLSDGQMHYIHRPGRGTPILFLHQTASSGRMWVATMERLDVANPLWAVDTPGFGNSFDPAVEPDMDDYVRWLMEAVSAMSQGPVHLVGHHTGAAIALAAATRHPGVAASLSLIGPSLLSDQERTGYAGKLGAPFRPGRSGAYLLKNWEYLRVGGADANTALLHREMIDMLRGWASRPHAYHAVWAQDTAAQLECITCPLHLISSPDDLLHSYFQRAGELRPDALRTTLSGGANFVPDLVPDEFAAALLNSGFYVR
ncbi:MAG: alpha/beta fold hydrolase [Sphingobium sp.]